mmetsp:Transcript_5771/g.10919  ORF Transcript_5771/g.10919 Transcript_5771/m.10919 type:complete len:334 (+) Transcript_5771:2-1003(+)
MTDQHRPVSVMPPQSEIVGTKVNELICRLRHDEEEKKKRRKQDLAAEAKRRGDRKRRAQSEAAAVQTTAASKVPEDYTFYSESTGKQGRSDFSSLYGDIFLKSNVAQLIVSPGGRILAWNERFVDITNLRASQISESLTVFNLVKAEFIPRTFELFSLALRGGSPSPFAPYQSPLEPNNMHCHLPNAQDGSRGTDIHDSSESVSSTESGSNADIDEGDLTDSSSGREALSSTDVSSSGEENEEGRNEGECLNASMDVPCTPFSSNDGPFFMTITLMNDSDPSKRCFHCVLAQKPHAIVVARDDVERAKATNAETPYPLGKIRRISYASLATLL